MNLTFLQLAKKVLAESQAALTPEEIWQFAIKKGWAEELGSKGKTPVSTLGARLYIELRDNDNTEFSKTDTRPKKFFLHESLLNLSALEKTPEILIKKSKDGYLEKDLHPFLVYFGFYNIKAYLKTINHHRSNKKEFSEWLHPDVVGCYFPFNDWQAEVVKVSANLGNPSVRLFAFEIKRELNFNNLRESFFQAVSNSSWANEGFLVAAEIINDADFHVELERLSSSFGIGVIQLDVNDPDSAHVIFPAKNRETIDWDTVNKLSQINPDFREFLARINTDINSNEVRNEKYDEVKTAEALLASIKIKQ